MPTLRWGILSTARINRRFVPGLQISQGSRLQAIASQSLERAREFARLWDIPSIYGSYSELLKDPEIDAVYIPLPNHLHHPWCLAAARAGKHVLCEKPLGLNLHQVDEMLETARQNEVHLVEAFQFLSHPLMPVLKDLLKAPQMGPLRLLRGHFSYALSDPKNIRLRYREGGGCLWDVGCYPVRFMLELVEGVPQSLQGMAVRNSDGIDLSFSGQILFPRQIIGQFQCSFLTPYSVGAEMVCEGGRIIANDAWRAGIHQDPPVIRVEINQEQKEIEGPSANPFLTQIQAFERLLGGDLAVLADPEQSRRLAATIEALHAASAGIS